MNDLLESKKAGKDRMKKDRDDLRKEVKELKDSINDAEAEKSQKSGNGGYSRKGISVSS